MTTTPAADLVRCGDRVSWLQERRRHIGGSDAAAILGESTFESPLSVWAEKVSTDPPSADYPSRFALWGSKLEPVIREHYAEETGRRVDVDPPYSMRVNRDRPWQAASLDGIVHCEERGPGVLQLKTAVSWKREDWVVEPPLAYQIQVQHEMAATGFEWGSLGVLIGGNQFEWIDVERNDTFIQAMLRHEAAFWEMVERGIMPEADGLEATTRALKTIRVDREKVAELPSEAIVWREAELDAKSHIAHWERVRDEARNKILASIGGAEFGVLPDQSGAYRRAMQHRDSYTVAATDFMVLRWSKKIPEAV